MTPDQTAEAMRRYKDGFSIDEIARHLGLVVNHVRNVLKEHVKFRSSGGAHQSILITPAVIATAREMLPDQHVRAIAVALDVPRTALRRALGLRNGDYTMKVNSEIHQICAAMRRETERQRALYDRQRYLRLQEDGRL